MDVMNTVRLIQVHEDGGRKYPVGAVLRKREEVCARLVAAKVAVYHGQGNNKAANESPAPRRRGCSGCGWR